MAIDGGLKEFYDLSATELHQVEQCFYASSKLERKTTCAMKIEQISVTFKFIKPFLTCTYTLIITDYLSLYIRIASFIDKILMVADIADNDWDQVRDLIK